MIVMPGYISFVDWAATLNVDLPSLTIPVITSEAEWKEWAQTLLLDNELVNIPLPINFDDWRIWAEFFINNV